MKLYVGNLPFRTTERDLRDLFEPHGAVTEVAIVLDRATGRSRGFAFVTMGNSEEGQAAIRELHGKPLGGRNLVINEARAREERPARPQRDFRGGGGGGGRGEDRGDWGDRGDRGGRQRRERY